MFTFLYFLENLKFKFLWSKKKYLSYLNLQHSLSSYKRYLKQNLELKIICENYKKTDCSKLSMSK